MIAIERSNEESNPNISAVSVIGLGYVGLCLSSSLAKLNIKVYCYDTQKSIIDKLNKSESPIFEPKLPELIKESIEKSTLKPTYDINEAIMNSNITFICVGTPCDEHGYIDLTYIKEVSKDIGKVIKKKNNYHVVSVKSTVIPGTTDSYVIPIIQEESGKVVGKDFGICMTPEFLREGKAIDDFFNPDKIVIGSYDERSRNYLYHVFKEFWPEKWGGRNLFVFCDLRTAEMIKYANNACLATRISFINEMANLAERLGVDIKIVSKAIGMDHRIGSGFLDAGLGFGGSCFPKDVKALYYAGKKAGYEPKLLKSVLDVNDLQPIKCVELIQSKFKENNLIENDLRNITVSLLGLSFKPNTDDIREAPSIKISLKLLELGANLKVYDPVANFNFKIKMDQINKDYNSKIYYAKNPIDAIKNSNVAIIVTEWAEFYNLTPEDFINSMNPNTIKIVIDGRRIFDPQKFENTSLIFYAIGYSKQKEFKP